MLNANNHFMNTDDPTQFMHNTAWTRFGVTPGVDVSWTLFDNFKVKINKKRLENLEQQSVGNSDWIIENNVSAIILAYYKAVREREKGKILQELVDASRDRYEYELARQESGTGSAFEVMQVKDAYWSDSISGLEQQNLYETALQQLYVVMGIEKPDTDYQLSDDLSGDGKPYSYDALKQKMLSSNRTLKNYILNQRVLQTNIDLQKSQNWYTPKVALQTGVGNPISQNMVQNTTGTDFNAIGNTLNFYFNFSVSFNLFDGGDSKRAIQNAIISEKIGAIQYQAAEKQLQLQLLNQLNTYVYQVKALQLNKERLANAQNNLNAAEERYKRGLIPSLNIRNIQLFYLNAANKQLDNLFQIRVSETELTRLTGGIVTE
jgi:outer membrane protein TolC